MAALLIRPEGQNLAHRDWKTSVRLEAYAERSIMWEMLEALLASYSRGNSG